MRQDPNGMLDAGIMEGGCGQCPGYEPVVIEENYVIWEVVVIHIQPGESMQNGYVERLNALLGKTYWMHNYSLVLIR